MRTPIGTILIVFVSISLYAAKPVTGTPHLKEPWQWDDSDRIAARSDRASAAERMAERDTTKQMQTVTSTATKKFSRQVDIVEGRTHPELFLPTELFEIVVRDGLVAGDTWREFYEKPLLNAGLPADFWRRLEADSQTYLQDLRAEEAARVGPTMDKDESDKKAAARYATACRDRYLALLRARKDFGLPLERLMYTYVAGKTTLFIDEIPEPSQLEAEQRGCQ